MDFRSLGNSWKVADQAAFFALFRRSNYRFKFFDLSVESNGDDVDVEFNYKDLAHLEVVHRTFNVFYSHISDDIYTAVILQNLLGFTFPVTAVSMQLAKNHLFVHTSVFNLILTSEIRTEVLPEHRVRVNTRYGVGTSRLLLPIIFPLVKWVMTRNYRTLMVDDIPMRNRRGEIRRWGFHINKSAYGFSEGFEIAAQHVVAPEADPVWAPVRIELPTLRDHQPLMVGRSDHLGLQVLRHSGFIEVYPRMCPHEGACLDGTHSKQVRGLKCAWHGRRFSPILKIAVDAKESDSVFLSETHRFVLTSSELLIEVRSRREWPNPLDWTQPAIRV
jgi:hypothetical protein